MSNKEDLLEEYFDRETSARRKGELRSQVENLDKDTAEVLFGLEEAIKVEPEVEELRARISKLKDSRKRNFFLPKVAASVLLLIGLLVVYKTVDTRKTLTNEELFLTYYTPYPSKLYRSDGQVLSDFSKYYQGGDYGKALQILESESKLFKNEDLILLYQGNCYLNLDRFEEAVKTFNSIKKSSDYSIDASWFLTLCYLKMDRIDQVKAILTELIKEESLYSGVAKDLMDEIE